MIKETLKTLVLLVATTLPGISTAQVVIETMISNGRVVTEPTSDIAVFRDGEAIPIAPGFILEEGDRLVTAVASQVVLIREPGSVEIYVAENSEIEIGSLLLHVGELYVRVKQKLTEVFEIESKYGTAGVEGTEFILRVGDESVTATPFTCVTFEGGVLLTSVVNVDEPLLVTSGQEFTLDADRQPTLRRLSEERLEQSVAPYTPLQEIYRRQSTAVQVPFVIGYFEEPAIKRLEDTRLATGEVEYILSASGAAPGLVLNQEPAPGETVSPDELVSLVIEGVPATVPRLVGLPADEVEKALEDANLVIGNTSTVDLNESTEGTVVEQSPKPGDIVVEGTPVDIEVEGESGVSRPKPPTLQF